MTITRHWLNDLSENGLMEKFWCTYVMTEPINVNAERAGMWTVIITEALLSPERSILIFCFRLKTICKVRKRCIFIALYFWRKLILKRKLQRPYIVGQKENVFFNIASFSKAS